MFCKHTEDMSMSMQISRKMLVQRKHLSPNSLTLRAFQESFIVTILIIVPFLITRELSLKVINTSTHRFDTDEEACF